ncbi:PREDICTED: endomucin isoform X1 [Chinchilla lanigera]|uniref:endomucin isoform X1 n=1 Tax=Chinchilla lanigera TaxID=34839 RepID=UPI00038F139F|nr:PREDICTED: endomucin isoform X1 [Chinchilla lanigera]
MTQLPAVTTLLLLLSSLCRGVTGDTNTSTPAPAAATVSTTKISVSTTNTTSDATEPTTGTSPTGTASTSTPRLLSVTPSTAGRSTAGRTTSGITKNESVTTEETVMNSSFQSSPNMTGNQSSINTTEVSVSTQQRDPPPSESTVVPFTLTSENISQFQGMEDGKSPSSSSPSPSYSSIILPVVIVLIVITLSVFVLVGLYQMCWKKDSGTPENGSDQPQSNKESVKLLTVKTISHESGERCVAEKTKN